MNAFTYFDVETPNRKNDRISSMGIIHVVDGITVHEGIYLVNPEVPFDRFNIELTGITPAMVKGKPTLGDLWPEIACYFTNAIIVAHNATFDLGVLTKTLVHYGYPRPTFRYICTMDKARRNLKFKRNSLDYLCATLGLTGNFDFGSKVDVELWLMARGGRCTDTLTTHVDYVIVGSKGSRRWAYGTYGTKVKRAMDMKTRIEIVKESEVIK